MSGPGMLVTEAGEGRSGWRGKRVGRVFKHSPLVLKHWLVNVFFFPKRGQIVNISVFGGKYSSVLQRESSPRQDG